MKQKTFLNNIKKIALQIDANANIFLFGSRARGDAKPDSDWDLLILTDYYPVTLDIRRIFTNPLYNLELESGNAINCLIFSSKEWTNKYSITPLYENVLTEGIKL